MFQGLQAFSTSHACVSAAGSTSSFTFSPVEVAIASPMKVIFPRQVEIKLLLLRRVFEVITFDGIQALMSKFSHQLVQRITADSDLVWVSQRYFVARYFEIAAIHSAYHASLSRGILLYQDIGQRHISY